MFLYVERRPSLSGGSQKKQALRMRFLASTNQFDSVVQSVGSIHGFALWGHFLNMLLVWKVTAG